MARNHDSSDPPLEAFLKQIGRDQEAGKKRLLAEYLLMFPGDDLAIARAFSDLTRDSSISEDTGPGLVPVRSLERGERLGHFHVLERIAEGGQGIVYEAEDVHLRRKVALKVLKRFGSHAERMIQRFKREAELTARLDHPGICAVHDAGLISGTPYIAMQFIPGETLARKISKAKYSPPLQGTSYMTLQSTIPADEPETEACAETPTSDSELPDRKGIMEAVLVIEKTAHALHAAHEMGITHRDIKPGNVMITPEGEPVILDFGLAHIEEEDSESLTITGEVLGTPAYMSPEQLTSRKIKLDHRTDIYSLGVMLFESLTLTRPFVGATRPALYQAILTRPVPDSRKLNPAVPSDLDTVIRTALEREPGRRYQTALNLADDLRHVRMQEPIVAKPVGTVGRLWRWSRRNRALALVGAVALLLVLGTPTALLIVEKQYSWALEAEQRQTEEVSRSRDHFLVLVGARALLAEVQELLPATPEHLGDLEKWLERADLIFDIRSRLDPDNDETSRDNPPGAGREHLESLMEELDAARQTIEGRRAFALSLTESVTRDGALWHRVASDLKARGVELAPQVGLRPFRRDPQSGLWEFWHIGSGDIPELDVTTVKLSPQPSWPVLLVLIPGGCFPMGTPDGVSTFGEDEKPAEKTIPPFFLSKYELTQAQYKYIMGANPSWYAPDNQVDFEEVTGVHPVETVTWSDARRCAHRMALRLPSEPEWEYCARAGSRQRFVHGNESGDLDGFANILDAAYGTRIGTSGGAAFNDRHVIHAPVGSFAPNEFGLHDMIGNVSEWCASIYAQDLADTSCTALAPGLSPRVRVVARGASWRTAPHYCYPALRIARSPAATDSQWGIRLARDVMSK